MTFKPLEKNNIRVLTSLNSKKILIIFFPSAATSFDDYKNFLNNITAIVDIVYVYAGYNGLIVSDKNYEPKPFEDFTINFYYSFKHLISKYKKVIILGQSFGACIAFEIYKKIQDAKLILVAPPLSEKSYKYSNIGKISLNLLTNTYLGKKITNYLEPLFLKLCNMINLSPSQLQFIKALRRSGMVNYFSCVREALKYGLIDHQIFSEDIIMVFGRKDPFLNNFCCQKNLQKRKNSFFLDYGHTILQKDWEFILKFL